MFLPWVVLLRKGWKEKNNNQGCWLLVKYKFLGRHQSFFTVSRAASVMCLAFIVELSSKLRLLTADLPVDNKTLYWRVILDKYSSIIIIILLCLNLLWIEGNYNFFINHAKRKGLQMHSFRSRYFSPFSFIVHVSLSLVICGYQVPFYCGISQIILHARTSRRVWLWSNLQTPSFWQKR